MKSNSKQYITITQQRSKCIGCNYCVEYASDRWVMSKKDGKSVLLDAQDKRGFFSVKVSSVELDNNLKAMKACPVNIISIS